MTLPERKMKSTNRQFRLELNPINNYLKMCLLNCILISIVTLTHSLPIQITLSSVIAKHPKFGDTLLNLTVVPFVNECRTDKPNSKQKMLCGSYFEMIEKLDDSNVNGLTTVEDFTKAMSVYNQTQIEDFCVKFPSYIPSDQKQYPDSYKLYKHVNKAVTCQALCMDNSDLDHVVVQQMCQVFAIGYQLSNTKGLVQPVNLIINSTVSQPSAEGIPNSENLQPENAFKSDQTADSVKQDDSKPSAALSINANEAVKQVIDGTVPKAKIDGVAETSPEKKMDVLDEQTPKENSSPKVEPTAEGSPKNGIGEISNDNLNEANPIETANDQTPTVKQDLKPAGKISNPSESPMTNAETAEKPAINAEQSLVDLMPENDEEGMAKDEDEKANFKVVTDDNDNVDDSDLNGNDKPLNMNDDSSEGNDGNDDEMLDPQSPAIEKSPSIGKSQPDHVQEDPFTDDTDSNFFTYFMFLLLVCVIAYVVYHNKSKMLALLLEGRRSNTNGRSGLSRRKHTAAYRKLDSNLEEAITSSGNGRSTQVIY